MENTKYVQLEIIKGFEKLLVGYKEKLQEKPDSLFYQGLVKTTEEYIKELTEKLNS